MPLHKEFTTKIDLNNEENIERLIFWRSEITDLADSLGLQFRISRGFLGVLLTGCLLQP